MSKTERVKNRVMRKIELWYGALLHDVGKIVLRSEDKKTDSHPDLGEAFISKYSFFFNQSSILASLKYHHYSDILNSELEIDSLAYITYFANKIANGYRNKNLSKENKATQKLDTTPLFSVFNVLNQNNQRYSYEFNTNDNIVDPSASTKKITPQQYRNILSKMHEPLSKSEYNINHFNALMRWMETYWSYIPSTVDEGELNDISLFDHSKVTCAIASCAFDFLESQHTTNYKEVLFLREQEFYNEKAFSLVSVDLSGIQDFIYNISGEKALKSLKSRSFYLEILLEVIVDHLLDELGYSRANLLYTGGGHAYLLIANTEKNKTLLSQFSSKMKHWFLSEFKTDVFLVLAFTDCSSHQLVNTDNGYKNIWKNVSRAMSQNKLKRYDASDIRTLNTTQSRHDRECKECLRSDATIVDGYCALCESLISFAKKLQTMSDDDFITVSKNGELPLPFGNKLDIVSHQKVSGRSFYKLYSKNSPYIKTSISTNLWVSNYFTEWEIENYAQLAQGINRLGVLRADIDNLGSAFATGIPEHFNSLARITTLSRKLSMFFKFGLDRILKENAYKVTVIYAGGDDLFLIGAWDDVINASIVLRDKFTLYTQGTLTLSAGIGMYKPKYPIYKMASETGDLEKTAKIAKNNVTLWNSNNVYHWDDLKDKVLNQKVTYIITEFKQMSKHNKTFMYNILTLLQQDSKLNIARLAYLLGKSEVSDSFSRTIFKWATNPLDKKALVTALEYIIYTTRKESDE